MTKRRGFLLIELTAACLILAALLVVCLELLSATALARRANGLRQTATEEATNAMERIAAADFGELTLEHARQLARPDRVVKALPGGKLGVEVDQPKETPACKRIVVTVSWQSRPEEPEQSVRLVAWKYPLATKGGPG